MPPEFVSTFGRILKFALVGGVIGGVLGCIAAVFMFGRSNVPGNDSRGILIVMVPAFCLIGAILGALDGVLFSVLGRFLR
jgi:hypothetical protein